MPELPEVETLRRSLAPCLAGQVIAGLSITNPVVLLPEASRYEAVLPGLKVESLGRRGKYLILYLSEGWRLVVHLRMTGRLLWYGDAAPEPAPHTHVALHFAGGGCLRFQDVRRFGRWWLTDEPGLGDVAGMSSLGPEPIDRDFSPEVLMARLARHPKAKIKAALLDQRLVAGLGNIYVDEALYAAGIHPMRPAGSLTAEEMAKVADACRQVLEAGIAHRGTSFRDYVDGLAQMGENQDFLQVFQREGLPCPRCGRPIRRIKVAGRSSFFCPRCQKAPS